MKKFIWLFIICTMLIGPLAAPVAAQETLCYDRNGIWDPATFTCNLKAGMTIDLAYPVTYAEFFGTTGVVEQFYAGLVADFTYQFNTSGEWIYAAPWSLTSTYEMYNSADFMDENLHLPLSFKFNISQYSGGAHPAYYIRTFNFAAGGVLTLDDLFIPGTNYLLTLATLTQQSLTSQLGGDADPNFIAQGTAPVAANYDQFVITRTELLIFFDPGEVSSYAMGALTARIPLTQLNGVLNPLYLN